MSFGPPTDQMIRHAFNDEYLYGYDSLTMEQKVLLALAGGDWVSGRTLALTVSHRFGGYLHTLKERGVRWDKRLDPDRPKGKAWWQYRLEPEGDSYTLF